MKKFLTASFFALALFTSVAGAAPVALAADTCTYDSVLDTCYDQNNHICTCPADPAVTTPPAVAAGPASGADNLTSYDSSKPEAQFGTIMTWIMSLFAWLVGVAALMLDYAVYYTVVTMGDYVKHLSGVGLTWRILRDLGNIVLIFGFIAIGISIILNDIQIGYGKKMLPTLLIVAVFLNFSLFISEAVIDTGNLFATQFYTQINGGQVPSKASIDAITVGKFSITNGGVLGNEGISNKIFAQIGLQGIYGNFNGEVTKGANTWVIGFMGVILFLIVAFVLFSLAFILISRFVVLVFLIIVAPIGFAGLVIPKLENTAKKWWHQLFLQTITAPILLLLLYIALAVITDANFLTGICHPENPSVPCTGGGWLGFIDGGNSTTGFASLLLSFLIAMGLLLAVVMVAKSMGAIGASWATKLGGKLSFGATGWAMNRTVGRGAFYAGRYLQTKKGFNKFDAITGRGVSRLLNRTAQGSFDFRGAGALKSLPFGGVDAGAAAKGGFTEARKKSIKAHEEAAKQIEEAHKDRFEESTKEKKAKEDADKALTDATGVKKAAQTKFDKAEAEAERLRSSRKGAEDVQKEMATRHKAENEEYQKLLLEKARNATSGRTDLDLDRRVAEAEARQKKNSDDMTSAGGKVKEALKALEDAEKAEAKASEEKTAAEKAETEAIKTKVEADSAPGKRMKEEIEAGKLAYAGAIGSKVNLINPFSLAYGPGSARAARVIKDSTKKPDTLSQLKKLLKDEDDKSGDKDKDAAKPAAPAPAPATPPGGTP